MAIDLLKQIFATADAAGARVALMTPSDSVTYRDLTNRTLVYAQKLADRGVTKDSQLILFIEDDINAVAIILACALIGCRWTPVDFTVSRNLDHLKPFFLVHDDRQTQSNENNHIYIRPWKDNLQNLETPKREIFPGYESPSDIFYLANSSGTTGKPKLIEISAGRALESMHAHAYLFKDKNLAMIGTGFPSTSFAGINVLLGALQLGVTFVILPVHILSEISSPYDFLTKHKIDLFVCAPDQLNTICERARPGGQKLRFVLLSGAPLPGPLINRALDYFSVIFNYYGSTETGRVSLKPYMEKHTGPVSVGKPFDGTAVEIVDDNRHPLPANQEGMVRIKNPQMTKRYFADPETTKAIFVDEWFYPGDTGMFDEKGELFITGRSIEIINIGGTKLNPQRIDDLFLSIEGIGDCVAFLDKADSAAPQLGLLVVLRSQTKIETVIDQIYKNLARFAYFQIPKSMYVVDKVPRNENGKALRRKAAEVASSVKPIALENILMDIVAQTKR